MSKSGFTRELLREKGFVIVDGVATRVTNFHQGGVTGLPAGVVPVVVPPVHKVVESAKEALRSAIERFDKPQRLNKLELRLGRYLDEAYPEALRIPQFRIRITAIDAPRLSHYTADFALFFPGESGWRCHLYEAKDPRRKGHSDELTRPTMALAENPWIHGVTLCRWDGNSFTFRLIAGQPNQTPQ